MIYIIGYVPARWMTWFNRISIIVCYHPRFILQPMVYSVTFFDEQTTRVVSMGKHTNKNTAKRREQKKRKKVKKRKEKLRSKTSRSIPTEYVSKNKLSEAVLEYAEPLTNAAGENEEKAIRLSVTFWNASLLPKQKALEIIEPSLADMANGDQLLKTEFYTTFEMMYNRKQSLFSNDRRFIVNYSLEANEDGFYLQVASTPLKNNH